MHLEDLDRINGLFFSLQTRLHKIEADISHADQMGIQVNNCKQIDAIFNQMPVECNIFLASSVANRAGSVLPETEKPKVLMQFFQTRNRSKPDL